MIATAATVSSAVVKSKPLAAIQSDTIDGSSSVFFQQKFHPPIYEYVQRFVSSMPPFSGQIAFDFIETADGVFAIECNPRAHTAVVLFSDTPALASAYLAAFSPPFTLDVREIVTPSVPSSDYYWIGHDLVTMLILPLLDAAWGISSVEDVMKGCIAFWEHVVGWRDGTFSVADPMPFLVLYHLYWPSVFLEALWKGKEWSRINVSTTKVFDA